MHDHLIGALLACALGIVFAAYPVQAEAPATCNNPATFVAPGQHLLGFAKGDARAFLSVLASISTEPTPPAVAAAVLIVAYLSDDPNADAMLRFFDANWCSVGLETSIPIAALHYIDMQMGVKA